MRYIAAVSTFALLTSLTACATPQTQTTVAQAAVALTAADQLAVQYVMLPLCGPNAPALCSTPTISAQIKVASQAAYKAIKAAEASGSQADVAAANAAVAALQVLLPHND